MGLCRTVLGWSQLLSVVLTYCLTTGSCTDSRRTSTAAGRHSAFTSTAFLEMVSSNELMSKQMHFEQSKMQGLCFAKKLLCRSCMCTSFAQCLGGEKASRGTACALSKLLGQGSWGLLPTVSQRALELGVCTSTAASHAASVMLYNLSTAIQEHKTFCN